jgi:ribose transport system substrate-binding protein
MALRFKSKALAVTTALGLAVTFSSTVGSLSSAGAATGVNPKNIVLVASVINTTNPYMASNIAGAQALGKKLGVPVQIVDSQGSSQVEISKIQAILAQGKTVVLLNTVASSDAPIIVDAVKKAHGFVSIWWNKPDSLEPWNVGNSFVAFQKHPGVASGACDADKLGAALGGKGSVVELPGVKDSTTSVTRVAGFETELKAKFPGIKILDAQPSNWDPNLAYNNTKTMIAKFGDSISGVWAADDAMQTGAMKAFSDAGTINKVKFASDGLYADTIASMQSGAGNKAIVGETFHRGYAASAIGLYTAYLAATGKIDPSKLPHSQRDSMFKIACVDNTNLAQYTKWDNNISGWIDTLIKNGPWATDPFPLVAGGPEKTPAGWISQF